MVLVKREEIQNFYCEFFELLKKKKNVKNILVPMIFGILLKTKKIKALIPQSDKNIKLIFKILESQITMNFHKY